MESRAVVARNMRHPISTPPPRGRWLRPEIFFSWTFLVPFFAAAAITYWSAESGPDRYEARLVVSMPRPQSSLDFDPRVDPSLVPIELEVQPLRVFFRSPERMRTALEAVEPRARELDETRIMRLSRRLANQVRVRGLRRDAADRVLVETTLWTVDPELPAAVLSFLGAELQKRHRRLDGFLERKYDEVREQRDAQEIVVQSKRDDIRDLAVNALPDGLDQPLEALLARDDWIPTLRRGFRDARVSNEPEAIAPDADLSSIRDRMRSLRQQVAVEVDLLDQLETQLAGLRTRLKMAPSADAAPLEILSEPTPFPRAKDPVWLLVIASVIGVAAGCLSLFLRLILVDVRDSYAAKRQPFP